MGITAFLDILGFGDRILSAQTNADIDAVVADITAIQEHFEFRPKDKHVKKRC
jgi:ribosomal protein S15P/S13E